VFVDSSPAKCTGFFTFLLKNTRKKLLPAPIFRCTLSLTAPLRAQQALGPFRLLLSLQGTVMAGFTCVTIGYIQEEKLCMANKTKKRAASAAIAGRNGHSLISDEKFKRLYATLLKQRLLEQHLELHGQLSGQLPVHFAGHRSQEAASTAMVIDLQPEDTLILSPASHHTAFIKGVPLHAISSHSQARTGAADSHFHYTHLNIMTIGASAEKRLCIATGAALASKAGKKSTITVVFLDVESEDATVMLSHCQEAFEVATAHALPIIYVLNNEAGITPMISPAGSGSACPTITVDGNDVVAVYRVAQESIARARQGGGPTLIESRPFHYAERPSADAQDDTVINMEKYLTAKSLFSDAWKQQLIAEFREELAAVTENNASLIHGLSQRIKNGAVLQSPVEEFTAHDLASNPGEPVGGLSSFT
jgi:TPP-dependent pyruvate/acetoin dehydrogenase alpha subunit